MINCGSFNQLEKRTRRLKFSSKRFYLKYITQTYLETKTNVSCTLYFRFARFTLHFHFRYFARTTFNRNLDSLSTSVLFSNVVRVYARTWLKTLSSLLKLLPERFLIGNNLLPPAEKNQVLFRSSTLNDICQYLTSHDTLLTVLQSHICWSNCIFQHSTC